MSLASGCGRWGWPIRPEVVNGLALFLTLAGSWLLLATRCGASAARWRAC